ncbi:MAG: hypothetical protein EXR52_04590 [Dehalococcoidia bacterium]|nr:hypothetical protein [Dehalococcoidia bacterium]
MLSPVCKIELRMTDRQGVEVDYCPQCRGMWLDRGELDKVLERAAAALQATQPVGQNRESERRDDYRDDRRRSDDDRDRGGHREAGPYPRKKKGGFLGELFEFGD